MDHEWIIFDVFAFRCWYLCVLLVGLFRLASVYDRCFCCRHRAIWFIRLDDKWCTSPRDTNSKYRTGWRPLFLFSFSFSFPKSITIVSGTSIIISITVATAPSLSHMTDDRCPMPRNVVFNHFYIKLNWCYTKLHVRMRVQTCVFPPP